MLLLLYLIKTNVADLICFRTKTNIQSQKNYKENKPPYIFLITSNIDKFQLWKIKYKKYVYWGNYVPYLHILLYDVQIKIQKKCEIIISTV